MKIITDRGTFDLSSDFQIQIDEKNPITNDVGSQSVPVTVPFTPNNARLTGFAHRPDLGTKVMNGETGCLVQDGTYIRRGTINLLSASRKDGFTLNVGFDNSEAYSKWRAMLLTELTTCPEREFQSVTALCDYLSQVLRGDAADDFAVFPLLVSNPSVKDGDTTTYYPEILNKYESRDGDFNLIYAARTENTVIDGNVYPTSLPEGFGVSPFLYIWKVLEIIFGEIGYEVVENPFYSQADLQQLVVINNAADACCVSTLHYIDLMPSCSVDDFMQALYARFGAVYSLNGDTHKVRIRLIRDIISAAAIGDFTEKISDFPLINYADPKQLKLSADNSLEGAATETERFEDLTNNGKTTPYYARGMYGDVTAYRRYLMLHRQTGRWFRYDKDNDKMIQVSSSFFAWDRKAKGLEYEDISSPDKSVPMTVINNTVYPAFITGSVCRYTDVRISDGDIVEGEKINTPLAFLIAFNKVAYENSIESVLTFGSILPYSNYGYPARNNQGNVFSFQLTWQFENGLFKRFWADYDAILRHAFNEIEAEVRLKKQDISAIDFLAPTMMNGQRMLVDSLSYSLPSERLTKTSMVLKTLRLIGPYDLSQEQYITPILEVDDILVWEFVSEDMQLYTYNAQTLENFYSVNRAAYVGLQEAMDRGDWYPGEGNQVTFDREGYLTPQEDMETFPTPTVETTITKDYQCLYVADEVGYYYATEGDPSSRVDVEWHASVEITTKATFRSRPLDVGNE